MIKGMVSCTCKVLDNRTDQATLGQVRMSMGGRPADAQCDRLGRREQRSFRNEATKAGKQLFLGVDMIRDRRPEALTVLSGRILLKVSEPLLEPPLRTPKVLHEGFPIGGVMADRRVEKVPLNAQVLSDLDDPGCRSRVDEGLVIRQQIVEQVQVRHASTVDRIPTSRASRRRAIDRWSAGRPLRSSRRPAGQDPPAPREHGSTPLPRRVPRDSMRAADEGVGTTGVARQDQRLLPGKAPRGNTELVALRILHDRPAVTATPYFMGAHDRRPEGDQTFDGRGIGIHQVEVHPVFCHLGLGNLLEVPGRLRAVSIAGPDGREPGATPGVERAVQSSRPESGDLEHIVAVERDIPYAQRHQGARSTGQRPGQR